jgi:DNA-binding MarR family transcriptional regulator
VAESGFDPIQEARRQWVRHGLDEPEAMAAATSIMRSQQLVSTAVDRALRPLGLTFARYEVLMLLRFSRRGVLPTTKMADRLMVHPTGITKLIDKLQEQGLVTREPNPKDRRGTLVRITPAGRRLATKATRSVVGVRFGIDLDEPRIERIVQTLTAFRIASGDFL